MQYCATVKRSFVCSREDASRYRCRQETATFGPSGAVFRKNSGSSGRRAGQTPPFVTPPTPIVRDYFGSARRRHRRAARRENRCIFSVIVLTVFFRPWFFQLTLCLSLFSFFFLLSLCSTQSHSLFQRKRITFFRRVEICFRKQRPDAAARSDV